MQLELKDYLALAALLLSLFNFVEARRAKARTLQQTFEQRRQEVLLVRTQRQYLLAEARQRLEVLKRDCEQQLPLDEKGRPHYLISTVALEISSYTDHFEQALSHLLDTVPSERISHKHLIDFEQRLGGAKRKLEEAKLALGKAKQFEDEKRKRIAEICAGEA